MAAAAAAAVGGALTRRHDAHSARLPGAVAVRHLIADGEDQVLIQARPAAHLTQPHVVRVEVISDGGAAAALSARQPQESAMPISAECDAQSGGAEDGLQRPGQQELVRRLQEATPADGPVPLAAMCRPAAVRREPVS